MEQGSLATPSYIINYHVITGWLSAIAVLMLSDQILFTKNNYMIIPCALGTNSQNKMIFLVREILKAAPHLFFRNDAVYSEWLTF